MGKLTTGPGAPGEDPALAALVALRRQAEQPPTEAQLAEGLRALRARFAGVRRRRPLGWRLSMAGAAAALLLVAGLWGASRLRSGWPMTRAVAVARIEGGALLDGGYLAEAGHAGVGVFFNEGSSFVLTPGTRGRLREVLADGARFAIEEGAASLQITPSTARRWSVEAGPFLVTVKGTAFNVAWDPVSERFELVLRRGHVVVSGPVAGGDIPLRAGQRLVIVLPRAETHITEAPAEDEAVRSAPLDRPAPPAMPDAKSPGGRAASAGATAPPALARSVPGRRWAELLAAGRWDRILADVDRDGVDATLGSASSEDLLALADAARYRRRVELARAALLAQRHRFPGSARALDALFLLGRVEELSADGAARAIGYYDDYLARAPRGGYAAEALGRKMILTNDLGGPGRARPIADEYLRRFPGGSYAGSARALGHAP
jgi:ferric-dicitrate binding protein FerR (iron transport regulator)